MAAVHILSGPSDSIYSDAWEVAKLSMFVLLGLYTAFVGAVTLAVVLLVRATSVCTVWGAALMLPDTTEGAEMMMQLCEIPGLIDFPPHVCANCIRVAATREAFKPSALLKAWSSWYRACGLGVLKAMSATACALCLFVNGLAADSLIKVLLCLFVYCVWFSEVMNEGQYPSLAPIVMVASCSFVSATYGCQAHYSSAPWPARILPCLIALVLRDIRLSHRGRHHFRLRKFLYDSLDMKPVLVGAAAVPALVALLGSEGIRPMRESFLAAATIIGASAGWSNMWQVVYWSVDAVVLWLAIVVNYCRRGVWPILYQVIQLGLLMPVKLAWAALCLGVRLCIWLTRCACLLATGVAGLLGVVSTMFLLVGSIEAALVEHFKTKMMLWRYQQQQQRSSVKRGQGWLQQLLPLGANSVKSTHDGSKHCQKQQKQPACKGSKKLSGSKQLSGQGSAVGAANRAMTAAAPATDSSQGSKRVSSTGGGKFWPLSARHSAQTTPPEQPDQQQRLQRYGSGSGIGSNAGRRPSGRTPDTYEDDLASGPSVPKEYNAAPEMDAAAVVSRQGRGKVSSKSGPTCSQQMGKISKQGVPGKVTDQGRSAAGKHTKQNNRQAGNKLQEASIESGAVSRQSHCSAAKGASTASASKPKAQATGSSTPKPASALPTTTAAAPDGPTPKQQPQRNTPAKSAVSKQPAAASTPTPAAIRTPKQKMQQLSQEQQQQQQSNSSSSRSGTLLVSQSPLTQSAIPPASTDALGASGITPSPATPSLGAQTHPGTAVAAVAAPTAAGTADTAVPADAQKLTATAVWGKSTTKQEQQQQQLEACLPVSEEPSVATAGEDSLLAYYLKCQQQQQNEQQWLPPWLLPAVEKGYASTAAAVVAAAKPTAAAVAGGVAPAVSAPSSSPCDAPASSKVCVVCEASVATQLLAHEKSGHLCLCAGCCAGYDFAAKGCPVCGEAVRRVVQVYGT